MGFSAIIIGIFVAMFYYISNQTSISLRNIDSKLNGIDNKLIMIAPILSIIYKKQIIEEYKSTVQGTVNPDPPDDPPSEKDILLQKLKDNTISVEEVARLKAILDKEAADARKSGNAGALLVILALLAILIIFLDESEKG